MTSYRRMLPGVFIGSHAISAGLLTRTQLRQRSYRRLVQGVYADPSLPFDHLVAARGVALLLPRGTVIGGLSAAAFHGAPIATPREPVTVVQPENVRWRGPRGVRVHRSDIGPRDVEVIDDVPVTTALRTAWDVATREPVGTAVAALDMLVRVGAVTLDALIEQAAHGAGRWGVTRVRRAVALVDPRAESPPESRVRVALVLAGLTPVPQLQIMEDDVLLGTVDLGWAEHKVALEYEGEYHFTDVQIDRDDARYERMIAAGWVVIRVSARELFDLAALVVRVKQVLASH